MKRTIPLALIVAALFLASLACSRAGEILTPPEATQRAQETARANRPSSSGGGAAEDAEFAADTEVIFTSTGFLVPLYNTPGATAAIGHSSRGGRGTILESQLYEGEIWYRVNTATGEGWLESRYVRGAVEETPAASNGTEGPEGPEGTEGTEGTVRLQINDTAYLAGKGYLINFMDQAGGRRIVANQQRGTEVTILDVVDVDGVTWYQVQAPTGEGWVAGDFVSAEAP